MDNLSEQLTQLAKLHADGALTDEEFKTLKTKIISEMNSSIAMEKTSPDRSETANEKRNRTMTAYAKSVSTEQLAVVEQRIANEDKSTALAYVLWFFLGTLGIHNFYIGKTERGIAELLLPLGGGFLWGAFDALFRNDAGGGALLVIPVICLIVWLVMWLVDLFIIPSSINQYREQLRAKYIAEFTSNGPPAPTETVPTAESRLKNQPALRDVITGSEITDEKPNPATTAYTMPVPIAVLLGFIAFVFVFLIISTFLQSP